MLEPETPSNAMTNDAPTMKKFELYEFKALKWQRRVQIQLLDEKLTYVLRCRRCVYFANINKTFKSCPVSSHSQCPIHSDEG